MLLTIAQTAEKLNVSQQTLRRWEKEGKIQSQKTLGGHRRYDSDLIDMINAEKIGIEAHKLDDPIYVIENFCKIHDMRLHLISLWLTTPQKKLIGYINDFNRLLIFQERQLGVTTCISALISYLTIMQGGGIKIAITSFRMEHIKRIIKIIKNMFQYGMSSISEAYGFYIVENESFFSDKIILPNGSEIIGLPANNYSFRGYKFDYIFIDNADNITKNSDDFYRNMIPSLNEDGKIIMTASGSDAENSLDKFIVSNIEDNGFNFIHLKS